MTEKGGDLKLESPRRILLIQLRALGDVILTTPALRVLKKRFPQAAVDFLANPTPAEALEGNPNLADIIVYQYKANDIFGLIKFCFMLYRNKYDIVIDFLGTPATALMTYFSRATVRVGYNLRYRRAAYTHVEQNYRSDVYNALTKFSLLKPLGIFEEEIQTEIFIPRQAQDWADHLFEEKGWTGRNVVAVAPFAKRPARRWFPERFVQVAQWLQENGHPVILLWGPGERDYVEAVSRRIDPLATLSPLTTLMQLAAILKRCRLLVCNCGGTKHVAVAVGTPTLTIHGPTDPRVWTPPDDPRHAYVRADLDCLDCGKRECEPLECMERISADQVIEAVQAMEAFA